MCRALKVVRLLTTVVVMTLLWTSRVIDGRVGVGNAEGKGRGRWCRWREEGRKQGGRDEGRGKLRSRVISISDQGRGKQPCTAWPAEDHMQCRTRKGGVTWVRDSPIAKGQSLYWRKNLEGSQIQTQEGSFTAAMSKRSGRVRQR